MENMDMLRGNNMDYAIEFFVCIHWKELYEVQEIRNKIMGEIDLILRGELYFDATSIKQL